MKLAGLHRAAALGLVACLALAGKAQAATVNFAATIDDAQENTCALVSTGQGAATATLNDVTGAFNWNITFGNNSPSFNNGLLDFGPEILAHFHGPAGPGVSAGIKVTLTLGSPKTSSTTVSSAGDRTDLKNGLWYINIHTTGCTGGEIRGQVLRVPSCGDGFTDAGETCDDGNHTNNDGCNASCQSEPPPPVPALSTLGGALLVLLLMAATALVLRRRSRHVS